MKSRDVKPKVDFVGVGVNKCGSTWIYECLKAHPEVCVTKLKEAHFFQKNYERGFAWYSDQYGDCTEERVRGEYSPEYLSQPDALMRIKQHYPDAKILVSLRNPIDRLKSVWKFNYGRGIYKQDRFEDWLQDCPPHQKDRGLYMKHLETLFTYFPQERVHIIVFDDIKNKPEEVVRDLYTFLDVESEYSPPILGQKVNPSLSYQPRLRFLSHSIYHTRMWIQKNRRLPWLLPITKSLGLNKLAARILKLNQTTGKQTAVDDSLSPETKQELVTYFRDDTKKLGELLDRNLITEWDYEAGV